MQTCDDVTDNKSPEWPPTYHKTVRTLGTANSMTKQTLHMPAKINVPKYFKDTLLWNISPFLSLFGRSRLSCGKINWVKRPINDHYIFFSFSQSLPFFWSKRFRYDAVFHAPRYFWGFSWNFDSETLLVAKSCVHPSYLVINNAGNHNGNYRTLLDIPLQSTCTYKTS